MKNCLHICLVAPLTVIDVLDLNLQPLCYGMSQGTGSHQPSKEDARRRDAGPCVNSYREGAWRWCPEMFLGACVLRMGFVFMQFMCTVLYIQLLIISSLVVLGQIYLFSVLFNTQITTAGAFNEFFKKKNSTVSHTFSHTSGLISCT